MQKSEGKGIGMRAEGKNWGKKAKKGKEDGKQRYAIGERTESTESRNNKNKRKHDRKR